MNYNQKYPELRDKILKMWDTHTAQQIIDKLKLDFSLDSLRKYVFYWNKKAGKKSKKKPRRQQPIGAISTRMVAGVRREYIKTEKGWRLHKLLRRQAPKKYNTTSLKQQEQERRVERKKTIEKKTYKTRVIDMTKLIPMRIPEIHATVYYRAGQDKEEVREKYLQQYRERLNYKVV